MLISLSQIKPNPINEEIYSTTDLTDLIDSLEDNGQLEPIVVNNKNIIISGHRRYFSMIQLGWEQAEVRQVEYDNEVISLIHHNQHRVKQLNDIINETRILEKEYKKKLGGQGKRSDLNGGKKFNTMMKISDALNVGTTKLKTIKSIYNYEPSLLDKVDKKEMSLSKAYKIVQKKYMKNKEEEPTDDKLKKLLRKESYSVDYLITTLKDVYPYSLLDFSIIKKSIETLNNKREELIDNMNFLKSLDEREIVIYKKLKEVEQLKYTEAEIKKVEKNIYRFSDINNVSKTVKELETIRPFLSRVKKNNKEFNILRILIHSMEWVPNPGRNIKYIVKDINTGKYLGIITLGSDVSSITSRDEYIGWSKDNKFKDKKLNNTCIASTIVPVQPLGYNFLLGKLLACMCSLPIVRDDWEKQYGDKLVGITTTSLYGSYSMYNSIPIWKKVGSSEGKIFLKPDDEHYKFWNNWIKENYKDEFFNATHSTGPKQNVIKLIFNKLGMKSNDYMNEHKKGVYFLSLYNNTKEYLKSKVKDKELVLSESIETDKWMDWWLGKAVNRYKKLQEDGKLKDEVLWYENLDKKKVKNWFKSRGIKFS